MVIVPHQDDDINLVGGLIELYTENGSEVSVVFTTNGDFGGLPEVRAQEVVAALTPLGVKKENIYYLGFGDLWQAQTINSQDISHIYLSPDPDAVWTSSYGATATYGTSEIDCYLDLPYTRNNYRHSIQTLILDKKPEIIFAVDLDPHTDHKAGSIIFEEALGQVLKLSPEYHPTVYKGFCYSTAWQAVDDYFDSINLQSSKKADEQTWSQSAFTYQWEDRLRFPIGDDNLNKILSNNTVFSSLAAYRTAEAFLHASSILNGDKVFWERRTDSMLYDAEIWVADQKTDLLNNFQLIDFEQSSDRPDGSEGPNLCSAVICEPGHSIRIQLPKTVLGNSLYLYDHPDRSSNILAGYITFSDGSKIDFSKLEQLGNATKIPFPEKEIDWLEITISEAEGNSPGLTEIELFYDTDEKTETFLMAVDQEDNFVYDYILQGQDSVVLDIYEFPTGKLADSEALQINIEITGKKSYCTLESGRLHLYCAKNETCTVTLSKDDCSTTFTVSNPYAIKTGFTKLLKKVDKVTIDVRYLLMTVTQIVEHKLQPQ